MIIVAGGIQIRHLVYRLTYNGDVVAFKMGRRQGAAVPISEKLSEMIIEDTLRGAPQAKRPGRKLVSSRTFLPRSRILTFQLWSLPARMIK
jgi:hypothetical protein